MDQQTALVLALQLVALFSIAGALLLYLLCKIQGNSGAQQTVANAKAVLITSADSALGLQLVIHLANRGYRVFAGLKDLESTSGRILRALQKHRESSVASITEPSGCLVVLPLDVTREDLLHESVDIIQAHLPAGEDGIWAVVNTSSVAYKGRLDQQEIVHWDAMLKTNVVGVLRVARTYQRLLRNNKGRLLTLGAGKSQVNASGLVAYTASRYGVEGASCALQQELQPSGIDVVILRPAGIAGDLLTVAPKLNATTEEKKSTSVIQETISIDLSGCIDYKPLILSEVALHRFDAALLEATPKLCYTLPNQRAWFQRPFQCVTTSYNLRNF